MGIVSVNSKNHFFRHTESLPASNIVTACFFSPGDRLPIIKKAVSVESNKKATRFPGRRSASVSVFKSASVTVSGKGENTGGE